MNRTMRYLLVNGALATLVFLGFGLGIPGAAAVVTFFTWVYFLIALAVFLLRSRIKMPSFPVPLWLDVAYDVTLIGYMVWMGHAVIAALYLLTIFMVHCQLDYPNKPV